MKRFKSCDPLLPLIGLADRRGGRRRLVPSIRSSSRRQSPARSSMTRTIRGDSWEARPGCPATRHARSATPAAPQRRTSSSALHRLSNRLRISEVVLLSLRIGANVLRWHQSGIVTKRLNPATEMMCADAGRSGTVACWRAVFPPGHATTSAAARLHRVDRGPQRETSSSRYRCRLRRWRLELSWAWRAPCLWCPFPASITGGAGARPDHPISGHSPFGSLDPPRWLCPQSHAINALNSRIIVLRSEWRLK